MCHIMSLLEQEEVNVPRYAITSGRRKKRALLNLRVNLREEGRRSLLNLRLFLRKKEEVSVKPQVISREEEEVSGPRYASLLHPYGTMLHAPMCTALNLCNFNVRHWEAGGPEASSFLTLMFITGITWPIDLLPAHNWHNVAHRPPPCSRTLIMWHILITPYS